MQIENKFTLIPNDVKKIIKILNRSHYEGYIVGGCVRDMILNKQPHDWDITTSAEPEEIIDVLKFNNIHYTTVGIDFGTIVAIINGEEYEITTFRNDGEYSDGRRPNQVKFSSSIIDDLSRRDFTINAVAYDICKNEYIDPYNGRKDIQKHIIKSVGEADKRISEDGLRILRAIRFASVYNFSLDGSLKTAIHENKTLLSSLSKERVTDEFRKLFKANTGIRELFIEFKDIISELIPEIIPCIDCNTKNIYHHQDVYRHMLSVTDNCDTNKFEIKLAALLHDIGKPDVLEFDEKGNGHTYGHPKVSEKICKNLLLKDFRLTKEEYDLVLKLVRYHDMYIENTDAAVKRVLNKHGSDFMNDFLILKQADIDDHIFPKDHYCGWADISYLKPKIEKILEQDMCFSLKNLDINGTILIEECGMKPGKDIGIVLNSLLSDVIENIVDNNKEDLKKKAKEYIENHVLLDGITNEPDPFCL